MAQPAKRPADKLRAETGYHADDAGWELLELGHKGKSLDLRSQYDLPVRIEADKVSIWPFRCRHSPTGLSRLRPE